MATLAACAASGWEVAARTSRIRLGHGIVQTPPPFNHPARIAERIAHEVEARGVEHDAGIAKISLVGAGMKTSPGIAAKMFRVLADEGINIQMISTSTISSLWLCISSSCVVPPLGNKRACFKPGIMM